MTATNARLPRLGLLYLDHVLRFFDRSNFRHWPDRIETVVYHWGNDRDRFIAEVKRKKIDVLIGNIPATAYEQFREIARALPDVRFLPSMDTQFANKSKENVTHFCEKYQLPVPKTRIFYEMEQARAFLDSTDYPKIIKRSYGPSNYGGYFVHKVDSAAEANSLLSARKYYPLYLQDFVPMKADIRVMLIGHKPVCAFWRRPPEGEWLTNTSQGGSMDYMAVPREAIELAIRSSRAANAEYWACDVAVSMDDQYSLLECATAFAAFPYIRDWIGHYLCWLLSDGRIARPHIPDKNWEELGKISSPVLRTLRHITFSRPQQVQPSCDGSELFSRLDENNYPMLSTRLQQHEEWPSEIWNRQDNYPRGRTISKPELPVTNGNASEDEESAPLPSAPESETSERPVLDEAGAMGFLTSVKGIGPKLADNIIAALGTVGLVEALEKEPQRLTEVPNVKSRKLDALLQQWQQQRSGFMA